MQMKSINKGVFLLTLSLGIINLTFGQTEEYEKIKKAFSNADVESIVSLAPEPEFVTLQFSTPNNPEIGVNKQELGKHLNKHFESLGNFEYTQLFNDKVAHLPLVVGKLEGNGITQYVMIQMANIGGSFRYVSFSFFNKLPSNMRMLDK